jgi:hypothetical protein
MSGWSTYHDNPEYGAPTAPGEAVTMGARIACLCAFVLLIAVAYEAGKTIIMCISPIG